MEEPIFAIEKDDDYYPEFKTCVKDTVQGYFAKRAELAEKDPRVRHYSLNEDKIDDTIERGLDSLKLYELADSDIDVHDRVKAEIMAKYAGGSADADDE